MKEKNEKSIEYYKEKYSVSHSKLINIRIDNIETFIDE